MTYEKSFKEEAVRLSDEIGVKKAAEQLGVLLHASGLAAAAKALQRPGLRRQRAQARVGRPEGAADL